MSFTLKCRTSSFIIISAIYVAPAAAIVTLLCFCASTVTLFSGLYSTICHYICSFIEILWATRSVFSYSFKFFISLERIIYCNYVKYDKSDYYSTYKSRWFLYKTACSMWISFNAFSSFYFVFSFLISLHFSFTHVCSRFIISFFHIIILYLLSFYSIGFVNFILLRFRMVFIFFVSIWVGKCSITFAPWQMLSLIGLKVVS